MAYGTAVHEDDRMVTLPRGRRRQTSDESSRCAADDLFKAVGRHVVAFIDDHLPIVTDAVIYISVRPRDRGSVEGSTLLRKACGMDQSRATEASNLARFWMRA
jgi:hypothetical protein